MTGKKYLIDNNLPYYFSMWNNEEYIHQYDLGDDWQDGKIWEYAKEHELTIITKDSDFSSRIFFKEPPPSNPYSVRQYEGEGISQCDFYHLGGSRGNLVPLSCLS